MKLKRLILSTCCCLYLLPAYTQLQPAVNDSFYSHVLQEQRSFHVLLPKENTPPCEVIYCLDDISDFIPGECAFLQGEGFIPKNAMVVGITNPLPHGVNMRDRDFTPTKTWDITGGAPAFLTFIRTELIPYINNKYHGASDGNILYGGSLGGLFVMYTLLNDPSIFTSYIAIDPSLWWDNELLDRMAAHKIDSIGVFHNTLYIGGREGNAFKEMGIADMETVLREKNPRGLDWKIVKYTNETHYSTNFKGFFDGLKHSYGGFYASTGGYPTSRKVALKPQRGIVLKGDPFPLICYNLMADHYLHYTTDGSIPDVTSPLLSGEETHITLQQSGTIVVKAIGARAKYDRMDSAHFEVGKALQPVTPPAGIQPGGLNYAYMTGTWDAFPDFKKGKGIKKGIAQGGFDINKLSDTGNIACLLTGYLKIDKRGYYVLEMGGGNQDSKVFLGDMQVLGKHFIKNDGENFLLPLEAGFYPIRIEFLKKIGGAEIVPIYIKAEGVGDFPLDLEMLYFDR